MAVEEFTESISLPRTTVREMHLGYTYWIIMWLAMSVAFLLAWLFIVKGCEVLDRKTRIDEQAEAKKHA